MASSSQRAPHSPHPRDGAKIIGDIESARKDWRLLLVKEKDTHECAKFISAYPVYTRLALAHTRIHVRTSLIHALGCAYVELAISIPSEERVSALLDAVDWHREWLAHAMKMEVSASSRSQETSAQQCNISVTTV
jgi:hypothetical protein